MSGSARLNVEEPMNLALGSITSIGGTYGTGCIARSGAWSAVVSGGQPPNPLLSVVTDNAACRLTVTSVVADQVYLASPPLVLSGAYAATGAPFSPTADGGGGGTAFYGNAYLSDPTFAGNFTISFLYSTNPGAVSGSSSASYGTVSAVTSATGVSSPSDTVDPSALDVHVTPGNVVQSAFGQANVIAGTTVGQGYVLNLGTLPASPTFANLDAAYKAGTPTAVTGGFAVPASAFGLVGVSLAAPAVRTIIIVNSVSGVAAYEAITITFTGAVAAPTGGSCAAGATVIAMTSTGNSGNFNTLGPVCVTYAGSVNGWNASNVQGRTATVQGSTTQTPTVSGGTIGNQPGLAPGPNGYIYWNYTAGSATYATMSTW